MPFSTQLLPGAWGAISLVALRAVEILVKEGAGGAAPIVCPAYAPLEPLKDWRREEALAVCEARVSELAVCSAPALPAAAVETPGGSEYYWLAGSTAAGSVATLLVQRVILLITSCCSRLGRRVKEEDDGEVGADHRRRRPRRGVAGVIA